MLLHWPNLTFQRAESLRTNLSSISTFDSALVRGLGAKATLLQSFLSSPSTNWTEVAKQILILLIRNQAGFTVIHCFFL